MFHRKNTQLMPAAATIMMTGLSFVKIIRYNAITPMMAVGMVWMECFAMMKAAAKMSPVEIGIMARWMDSCQGEVFQLSQKRPTIRTKIELGRNIATVATKAPKIAIT